MALGDWDWTQSQSRVLGALIGMPGRGARRLLLLFNAEPNDTSFDLPDGPWQMLRNWGMKGFERSGLLKHWMVRQAAGL